MPGNGAAYAAKKRKKPVQKMAKPLPEKTNPSKRHRDRLNVELDRLTSLLPFSEEVRGRLDKLSVLRLSVGYLKAKSYCHVALQKRSLPPPVPPNGRNGESVSLDGVSFSEGDLLLQALNGFVLVVTTDGMVFYTSPTIQDFLGFHQSDVVHQSVYDLIHMDDREMFRCQLHFALNPGENHSDGRAEGGQSGGKAQSGSLSLLPQHIPPENSSFLERSFCCRLRCLLDNNSGFLALNFSGRLKYLHLQGNTLAPQLALFAIATPVQPPSVMEIRTKTLIFQSKHRMDFAPLGIDTRGKLVLGYTEIELVTTGSGYQFIHAADMMYCADNHLRMIKTGDSGFTFFRLLMKTGQWLWVQANARIVFKGGRPDFIIARQKALTNEEGEEHLHQRRQQLPFNLATGEGVLYDTLLDDFSMPGPPGPPGPPGSGAPVTAEPTTEKPLDPASLLGSLRRQDHSIYTQPQTPSPQLPDFPELDDLDLEQPESSYERAFLDSHALLSVPGQVQVSPQRSVTGDFTSDAMMDSLEQILGDIGEGSVEGLEVKETELKEWENALVRMNNEREDASRELDRILANDVFSYVEEALRRETGGFVPGPDQTHVSGNGLSLQRQHAGSVFSNSEQNPGFAQQTLSGLVLGGGGCPTGLRGAPQVVSHTLTPTPCRNTHQAHPSPPWPRMISTQSCHDATQQSWFPSVHDTNNAGGHRPAPELTDQSARYTLNHVGSQHAYMSPQLQSPSVWPPQQLHTLTHSSHTPGGVNSTAPQTQRSSGSCMYEKREGHMPNAATVPARRSGPLPGLAGPASAPFALSHPGADVGQHGNSNTVGLVHMSGGVGGPGASRSDYPPGNGSLESSFFCWSGEAQIPRGPLNGVVDPFAFPARPTGSVNLSQNTGS